MAGMLTLCLLVLRVSLEGPALRYFHILLSGGKRRTFGEISSQFKQRSGKGILQTASQVEFSSMAQEADKRLEQWANELLKPCSVLLGRVSLDSFYRKQAVLRFAMGCQDILANRQLIDSPPMSLDERVRLVNT